MKKEKTPNLDNVQKSRYRLSSEYFTKGASEWVRNSAKNFGFGGVYDFQKKLEKEKQRVLARREEQKKNTKKIKKQKTPFDKYLIGLKIGAFVAASVALVVAFNKINSLFDQGKRKADEITKDINNVVKEKIGFDLAQVDEYIAPFVTKISESVKTDIINPIQTGLDKFFGVCGEEKQYSSLTESGLSENQKKYGIVGCVFRDVALAALRRTLIRRGYGLVMSFFNIDDPSVRNEIDLTFWNYYKSPANTFFHVGRDLVSSGIRGAELYNDDFQKRLSLIKGEVKGPHASFLEHLGLVKTDDSTVNENTIDKIIENIGQNNEKATEQMPDFQFILPKYVVTKKQTNYLKKIIETPTSHIPELQFNEQTDDSLTNRGKVEETKDWVEEKIELDIEYEVGQYRAYSNDWGEYEIIHKKAWPRITGANITMPYDSPENKNLRQIVTYTGQQYYKNYELLPEQLKQQVQSAFEALNSKEKGQEWQWSAKKYFILIQMFNFFSKWELYQGVRSLHSTRMLLQDFVKEQEVEVTYNAVKRIYNEDKRLADKFVIDYTKGNLTIDEFSSKLLKSLEQKKALGILENDLKFGILEIQKKIPYGKYKSDLWNIRKKIQEMSISGVDTKDVTVINYQSFREAMKVDKNYDRNSKIEGRQFGYQYVPNSSGDVFSGDENAKVLLGNEGKPYFYVAMWRTDDNQGHRGKWTNGFVGYKKTYNLEKIEQLDTYSTSVYSTSNDNDAKNHENIKKDNLKLLGDEPAKVTYNYRYYVPMQDDWQEAKKDLYLYIYEERVGYKALNRYETVDDDGNFFLQDIWSYYSVGEDGKKTWMGYVYGEKTKSKKSLPSIFQGEYDEKDLETLYNLPQEVLFQRLSEARDYISDKLQQVFEERHQIFSEMLEKLSQNQK